MAFNKNIKNTTPPILAKLSPPRLAHYYPRERLFQQLDTARTRPVTWISAPAGYGKTTLVASYLKERGLKPLWYQCDARDVDPATFFHYMRNAALTLAGDTAKNLPLMQPENLPGLTVFARNFFDQLFALLHEPTFWVLDNVQDLPEQSPVMTFLPAILAALPEHIHIMLISRHHPPPSFARLQTHQILSLLTVADIALDQQEITALAARRKITLSNQEQQAILASTQGWAAGVVLLLERVQKSNTVSIDEGLAVDETVFDYLATEVFEQAKPELQTLLLKTACLPEVTADLAKQLTGLKMAANLLNELVRNNYFTYHQTKPHDSYQYHPLFRQFLLTQANQKYTPEQFKQLIQQAARLLAKTNNLDDAAQLAIEGEEWELLSKLLLQSAESLLQQGRCLTLQKWITNLPPDRLQTTPWLLYWYAASYLPFDIEKSRELFEQAYQAFKSCHDAEGIFLAWSGVIDTYIYEWGNFSPLDGWIEEFEAITTSHPTFPSEEVRVRVVYGIFCALMYRQPHHPALPKWEAAARDILSQTTDVATRVILGSHLILYDIWWAGNLAKATALLEVLRPAMDRGSLPPLIKIVWYAIEAAYHWVVGTNEEGLAVVQKGLQLAEESGIHLWDVMLLGQGVWAAMTAGKLAAARGFLAQMQTRVIPSRRLDMSHFHFQSSLVAWHGHDTAAMQHHGAEAVRLADEAGVQMLQGYSRVGLSWTIQETGETSAAKQLLAEAMSIARHIKSRAIEYTCLFPAAMFAADEQAVQWDTRGWPEALSLASRQGFVNHPWWRPVTMSRLCAEALDQGIEVEFVQRMIRLRRLKPVQLPTLPDNWPWSLKIHTLGRFSILRDDEPLVQTGKGTNKLLALLQALIALGGREVNVQQLSESLWPEAEGDHAQQNLKASLHRLRKWLGSDDLIQLKGHLLSFNPQQVWIDAWGLECLMGEIHDRLQSNAFIDEAYLDNASRQLLDGYKGSFLHANDEAWVLLMRERLRSKFLRAIRLLGQAWDKVQAWEKAANLYLRALEIDPLAEDTYQLLMRSYQQQGRNAEAIVTYQHCREQLEKVLQVTPSPETERLYRDITGH